MANLKIERLNHAFQEQLSMVLLREVKDQDLKLVTITGVDTTSDLSFAKVYYTVLEEDKKELIEEKLKKAAPFLRTELASRVEVRHTPELKFVYDTSIEYGNHIESIIQKLKNE